MPLLAATATPATLPAIALLTVLALPLLWLAGYALACWLHPFTRCRWCQGTATRRRGSRLAAPCRHCDDTGRRLRLGRQLSNHLHHLHHQAGTRHEGTR